MTFSLIVCTYNGAARLPETLRHLAALRLTGDIRAALYLADNASTDDSAALAQACWTQYGNPYPLQVLTIPVPGKGFALAGAVQHIQGQYAVICDDDNHLPPDYLEKAQAYMQGHAQVGILVGSAKAITHGTFPDWFVQHEMSYACGPQYAPEGDCTGKKLLWSAGMCIESGLARKILVDIKPMMLTGRKGHTLISGEDDEICLRAWLLGYKTHYHQNLFIYHCIAPERLNKSYLEKLHSSYSLQVDTVGAYRRLYACLQNPSGGMHTLRQAAAFMWYSLTGDKRRANHAKDFLFFLTRARYFQTGISKAVWDFYTAAGMPLGRP